jgi:CBS domain-containing protein
MRFLDSGPEAFCAGGGLLVTVRQLLQHKPAGIVGTTPEKSVYDALRVMGEHNIGAVVVTEGGRLVGIFSERDYARKIVLRGKRSRETPVREVMTPDPVTVRPDDSAEHCMELMTHRRVRHLPVLEEGRLVGLVSIGDVVRHIISQQAFEIEQLEHYIHGPS